MIVEDSPVDRLLLSQMLKKQEAINTIEVNTGLECLSVLEESRVDLILLDFMMPNMNGNEVLKAVRKKYNSIQLPIILVTGKTDDETMIESFLLGANDYITKPLKPEVALSRIKTHLRMADISDQMIDAQKLDALKSLVATYNHELNNPLAIALNCISIKDWQSSESTRKNLEDSLWRMSDIIKNIGRAVEMNSR